MEARGDCAFTFPISHYLQGGADSVTARLRVGEAAKNAFHTNPANTIFDAKRLIGRKISDPEVQADMKHWPFAVKDVNGKAAAGVEYKGEEKTFVSSCPDTCNSFRTNSA